MWYVSKGKHSNEKLIFFFAVFLCVLDTQLNFLEFSFSTHPFYCLFINYSNLYIQCGARNSEPQDRVTCFSTEPAGCPSIPFTSNVSEV